MHAYTKIIFLTEGFKSEGALKISEGAGAQIKNPEPELSLKSRTGAGARAKVSPAPVSSKISDFTPYEDAQSDIQHNKYAQKTDD